MQSFGHGITFGRVCYVTEVGAELLDLIEKSGLPLSMTGDGLVATTHEALNEHLAVVWTDADGAAQAEPTLTSMMMGLNAKAKLCEEFLLKIRRKIEQANEISASYEVSPTSMSANTGDLEPINEIIFSK